LDKRLFGGFNRGELNIFAGGSGSGKSLFMANMGVNWCLQGMNVMYLTFELSENLVSMRLDAMTSEIPSRDIFKQIEDVQMKVKMIGKKSGAFQVKYMPTGKNANDVRAYLKEYEIKTGKKVDVLLIDYLDLMSPIGQKISAENLFVKDKYVSEELRNLAMELNCIFVTASQLNRSSVEEIEFDHSHISGGISKINTADNLIGIFTSRAMRERGRYQIQLMKTRSSSGVGMKVDLGFDVDTLRIFDLGEDDDAGYQSAGASNTPSNIVSALKRTNTADGDTTREDPAEGSGVGKIRAETDSTKLRAFLNNLSDE
jgi:archaellum biogenesis ATPase FlaH